MFVAILLAEKIQKWGEEVGETPPDYSSPVNISSVRPQYSKTLLKDQNDVEEYVQAFKAALLAELDKGNSLLVN